MICTKAAFRNFRNIESAALTFDPGVNVIYGNNAQGKTSALEGIYLTAQGRSHRAAKEKDFIRFGSDTAEVNVGYSTVKRRDCSLRMVFTAGGKKYCRVNGVPAAKMSEFIGNFRAILFTPEHLSIVKNGPSNRRLFLDSALSQIDPGYVADLQNYNKCLLQRNKLLAAVDHEQIGFEETVGLWSERLAGFGERISAARDEYVAGLQKQASLIFSDMTGGREKLSFAYRDRKNAGELLRLLTVNLDKEIKNRATLYGIHKDDVDIIINGRSAREFGSQGQQRSAALAMKLAEGELSKTVCGEYPVFLFDDIMSELDPFRRAYVMNGIAGKQVLITTCDKNVVSGTARSFYCENGSFFEG